MEETEVDRPGHLPSSVDCVKWAADGRLALNLGTLVMVYHPRTNAGELYNFSSSSVACPGPDQQIIDLQRYPGKAGDVLEVGRKGFKYLLAADQSMENAGFGGNVNNVMCIEWSCLGCAWDGGCLLCVSSSLHSVTVFQPPRSGAGVWEWEPIGEVSKSLVHWALRICPTEGAKKMKLAVGLGKTDSKINAAKMAGRSSLSATEKSQDVPKVDEGDDDQASHGNAFPGIWAVSRAVRTRAVLWIGDRLLQTDRWGDGRDAEFDDREGEDDFTLLGVAGEYFITLWAFSAGAALPPSPSTASLGSGAALSLGFVGERPAWGGDLRALGALGAEDGDVRTLAYFSLSEPALNARRRETEGVAGQSTVSSDSNGSARASDARPGLSSTQDASSPPMVLAVGTSSGAVILLRVTVSSGRCRYASAGDVTKPCLAVEVTPLRRVCTSDRIPVASLRFLSSGEGKRRRELEAVSGVALAVAKGPFVTVYPNVSAGAELPSRLRFSDTREGVPKSSVKRNRTIWTSEAGSGSSRVRWQAHEDNVTAVSTAPSPGPISAPFVGSVTSGSPSDGGIGLRGKHASTGGEVGGEVGVESGDASQRESFLVYTSSMDGSCHEWYVDLSSSGAGASGESSEKDAGTVSLRKSMCDGEAKAKSPPILGCAASPNGVLIAWVIFAPPERSARKAVEHIARKGTHCRLMVTPMVPFSVERLSRAPVARDDDRSVRKTDSDEQEQGLGAPPPVWRYNLVPHALLTDWAWYTRAAAFADVAVQVDRDDSTKSSPLIPFLCRRIEEDIAAAVAAGEPRAVKRAFARALDRITGEEAAPSSERSGPEPEDPDRNGGSGAGSLEDSGNVSWHNGSCFARLLKLQHVVLSVIMGLAVYRASLRPIPEVDRVLLDPADDDQDVTDDEEDGEDGKGQNGDGGDALGAACSKGDEEVRERMDVVETEGRVAKDSTVVRAEAALAIASAEASAARTRVALVQAWSIVLNANEVGECRPSSSSGAALRPATFLSDWALVGDSAQKKAIVLRARRFLDHACRVTERRREREESGKVEDVGRDGLAIPSAKPPVQLPCLTDVANFLSVTGGNSDERFPQGKCLLCEADLVTPDVPAGVVAELSVGGGDVDTAGAMEGEGSALASDVDLTDLELPGWTLCRFGHRLARCMDTLAPSLSVMYRRCDVCGCVREVSSCDPPAPHGNPDVASGEQAKGGDHRSMVGSRGSVERRRGICILCGVLAPIGGTTL